MAFDAPRPLGPGALAADFLLKPLMWAAGGFRRDSIQETHAWHCTDVDVAAVDHSLGVVVRGNDRSRFLNSRSLPLFHVPLLGGWRSYVTLERGEPAQPWHIGWAHLDVPSGARRLAQLNRLELRTPRVRVLKQPRGFTTVFFAVGADGRQLPLRIVGEGTLGDGSASDVRLL